MSDNEEIEMLKKQLEAEKEKREQLEFQIQYTDKITGLPNRKYLEKLVADGKIDCSNPDFSIVYVSIDGLKKINDADGDEVGDSILLKVVDILKSNFREDAKHFKLVGTKFCSMGIVAAEGYEQLVEKIRELLDEIKKEHTVVDFTIGAARSEEHEDVDIDVLLKEAEYAFHLKSAEKDVEIAKYIKNYGDKKTILMIDDSLVQLRAQQAMLKDDYKLLLSTSGLEGYEIAKAKQPDLILLDYNMPVVDGSRIMHLLKKSKSTADIPVIFVTGVDDREKIMNVVSLQPAGYLLKPVAQNDLINTVRKAVGQ